MIDGNKLRLFQVVVSYMGYRENVLVAAKSGPEAKEAVKNKYTFTNGRMEYEAFLIADDLESLTDPYHLDNE